MRYARERSLVFASAAVIFVSAVMVVQQVIHNQSRHAEMREAFIYFHSKGYHAEAQRLYTRMVLNLQDEPTRHLIDDLQRTSSIAPTNQSASTNILVRFHVSIRKELEKRFEQEYLDRGKVQAGN